MQNIIHTNLYGEKNFNVINIALHSNCDITAVGYSGKRFKHCDAMTCKKFGSYDRALLAANGEIVMLKSYALNSIKSLYYRLHKLIQLLKDGFSADNEFYFIYPGLYYDKSKVEYMKQMYGLIEKNIINEYSVACLKYLYFNDVAPMKISDFETTYAELKKPTYNHKIDEFDEFVTAQNKMLISKFLDMMTNHTMKYGTNKNSKYEMHGTMNEIIAWTSKDEIYNMFYAPNFRSAFIDIMTNQLGVRLEEFISGSKQAEFNDFCDAVELMRSAGRIPNFINIYNCIGSYMALYNV